MRIFSGKNILKPVVYIAVIIVAVWLLLSGNIFSGFKNLFKRQPVVIENTAAVITQIKDIAELNTIQMYAEVVADSSEINSVGMANTALKTLGFVGLPLRTHRKLVIIAKGTVKAGIDFQKLDSSRIFVQDDSIRVQLPAAKYLDIITNPSDFDIFVETGTWTTNEVNLVKMKAQNLLVHKADEQKIISQANTKAVNLVESFLKNIGYRKVYVFI
ncbi:DUF4230 domain-containing protein [Polluticaenibacter yanchengensis]|uniref:DUF4230 domain-containing protein n=1 Tax=Polluticaenibacter yanchengensis TaxID=3014562 RepID=A0ABT4UH71_9BACT|nr:DUF4230 domain-containing protein [Chitinophagaceae bacterium LY-5]